MIAKFLKKHSKTFLFIIKLLNIMNFIRKKRCGKTDTRCEYDPMNIHYKYTLIGDNTPLCCMSNLYEILRSVTMLFDEHDVEYFIMYGTLLGQVRHNKTFIPWDTDVDVVVMKNNKEEVINLLIQKLSNIYFLQTNRNNITRVNYSSKNRLHADIYYWEEKEGFLIDRLNDYWLKNRVEKQDVFPLINAKLYDLEVKMPRNSIKVLQSIYGEDCLEKAYKKYAYRKEILTTFNAGKVSIKSLSS